MKKHVKILGLLAAGAAALMSFAGPASATTITSPEGTAYTDFVNGYSSNTELDGAFVTVKCGNSNFSGYIWSHGSSTALMSVSGLAFTECNYQVTVNNAGSLEIDSSNTVKSSGASIEIKTSVGTCVFTTLATDIGTLTEGKWPHLDINSAKISRTGGNFLCGSSGTWTGSYTIGIPVVGLWVD